MAINTGYQHQQPVGFTAAVRSTPSPQHAARLRLDADRTAAKPSVQGEEKSFEPHRER